MRSACPVCARCPSPALGSLQAGGGLSFLSSPGPVCVTWTLFPTSSARSSSEVVVGGRWPRPRSWALESKGAGLWSVLRSHASGAEVNPTGRVALPRPRMSGGLLSRHCPRAARPGGAGSWPMRGLRAATVAGLPEANSQRDLVAGTPALVLRISFSGTRPWSRHLCMCSASGGSAGRQKAGHFLRP